MPTLLPRCLALVLFCAVAACGGAEVGEDCDDEGSTDECVDGAICTNESGDKAVCRLLCKEQEDCPADHACNGVSETSRKSCQPDETR